jgi:septum formation protein
VLILASGSPYRAAQLRQLGLEFEMVRPEVDELALHGDHGDGIRLAVELAEAKALAVLAKRPGAVVVAGDQTVQIAGESEFLTKPGDRAGAIAQLTRLAGRSHVLASAVCVAGPAGMESGWEAILLEMRELSAVEIERYVDADKPFDCVGSYKFESRGATLFARLSAGDPTAIVGLPLVETCRLLRRQGIELP